MRGYRLPASVSRVRKRITSKLDNIEGDAHHGDSGGKYLSQLERDDFKNWILNPDVERIDLQQPVVKRGRSRFIGDLLIHFKNELGRKRLVVQIKYQDEYNDPEVKADVDGVGLLFQAAGYDFVVRTEADVYGPDYDVLDFLLWARVQPGDSTVEDWIVDQVNAAGEITVRDLLAKLSEDRLVQLESVYKVWRVVAFHRVVTLWRKPLNEDSVLKRKP